MPRNHPPGRSQTAIRSSSGPSSSRGTWLKHVERDDRVERLRLELDLREVGVEERGARDALPRAAHLLGGDVDPGQVRALGQHARRAHARARAELEHVRMLREQRQQLLERARAGVEPVICFCQAANASAPAS